MTANTLLRYAASPGRNKDLHIAKALRPVQLNKSIRRAQTCVTGCVRPEAERTVQPKYSLKRPVDRVALIMMTLRGEPASRLFRMRSLRGPRATRETSGEALIRRMQHFVSISSA